MTEKGRPFERNKNLLEQTPGRLGFLAIIIAIISLAGAFESKLLLYIIEQLIPDSYQESFELAAAVLYSNLAEIASPLVALIYLWSRKVSGKQSLKPVPVGIPITSLSERRELDDREEARSAR